MITVRHHAGEYNVVARPLSELFKELPSSSFILTDDSVARAFGRHLPDDLPRWELPAGEGSKNLTHFGRALEWLATAGASRRSTLVALGGGVVGDLAGFVAASYMRGIPYIQIPTTLLAQVDSSVGGKVGVDLPQGKNLAGAFHPPVEVRLCAEALATLPERQFVNGVAEVCKYGFIMDAPLSDRLSTSRLSPASPDLAEVVTRCIQHKADVVERDEFERHGIRATLNFGHTVGHALEQVLGYEELLHGEAISIGMVVEAELGERLGVTPPGTKKAVEACLIQQGLPTHSPVLHKVDPLIVAMRRDKKARDGRLAFSLLTHMGGCKLFDAVDESEVRAAIKGS